MLNLTPGEYNWTEQSAFILPTLKKTQINKQKLVQREGKNE